MNLHNDLPGHVAEHGEDQAEAWARTRWNRAWQNSNGEWDTTTPREQREIDSVVVTVRTHEEAVSEAGLHAEAIYQKTGVKSEVQILKAGSCYAVHIANPGIRKALSNA